MAVLKLHRLKIPAVIVLFLVLILAYYHHLQPVISISLKKNKGTLAFRGEVQHPLTSSIRKKLKYMFNFLYSEHSTISPKIKSMWNWHPNNYLRRIPSSVNGSLTVSPDQILNGEVVHVHWNKLHLEIRSKVLALYCPSSSPHDKFIDYWTLDEIKPITGMKVVLYNIRTDCQFRLFSNATIKAEVIAVSNNVKFKDAEGTPEHGHLALTDSPYEMRVQWTSGANYSPVVLYGLSSTDLPYSLMGSSRTYSLKDLCGEPANMSAHFIDPGQLHDVLLTGLKPNTKYFYRYGNKKHKFSSIKSFTTPPMHGSETTVKFIIYGDMDITPYPGSEATVKHVLHSNNVSFILHIGDMSYAGGLGYRWDEWMTMIAPIASAVPYMVTIGNHEQCTLMGGNKDPSKEPLFHPYWGNYLHDSGGECGVPLLSRFHMPDNGNHLFWYTFTYGSIFLIQLSSEHDYTPGSHQYMWLMNTLNKINRHTTPWVIVASHRPMYCSSLSDKENAVSFQIQRALEALLVEHNVDLFIGGHYHAYERTCHVYKSKCNSQKGMVHIVVGTAGSHLDSGQQVKVDWSLCYKVFFGYGRISVNRTSLLWEFVRNDNGEVIDSVVFNKL